MFDLYLAGEMTRDWRNSLKSALDKSITIFDPYREEYDSLTLSEQINETAKGWSLMEDAKVIVFYFGEKWGGTSSLLELGDCIGRNKQIVVFIDRNVPTEEQIQKYCEFRGVVVVKTFEDLVATCEEFVSELCLCGV